MPANFDVAASMMGVEERDAISRFASKANSSSTPRRKRCTGRCRRGISYVPEGIARPYLARDGAPKACRAHLAMPADQPDADLAASPSDSRLRVDSSGLFSLMGTAGIGANRKLTASHPSFRSAPIPAIGL